MGPVITLSSSTTRVPVGTAAPVAAGVPRVGGHDVITLVYATSNAAGSIVWTRCNLWGEPCS
jgi:hypothetical protein